MRVVVVGCKGRKKSSLVAYGKSIGLKVVVHEVAPTCGIAARRVIIWATFSSHSALRATERRSAQVRVVHGGLTAVLATLRAFAAGATLATRR